MLTDIGVFREMSSSLRRSMSPMQPGAPRQMQHRRQDSYKRTQRHKVEMQFMTRMWGQVMKGGQSVEREVVIEAMKIILNHYIPNGK